MCGIVGIIRGKARDNLGPQAEAMALRLKHRGPDSGAVWVDPELPVALGHRRLSIVELSPLGAQPMVSADGRYWVTFNGEIYNFRKLRQSLETRFQSVFRGGSDTEVMLEAFVRLGIEPALKEFEGMFAFALWDRVSRQLTLGRDRLGEKPLYYGWHGGNFIFASELGALWGGGGDKPEISRDAVARFLEWNYVPTPGTIFKGIYKLEQGSFLTLGWDELVGGHKKTEAKFYWRVPDIGSGYVGSFAEGAAQLEATLIEAIRDQMLADVLVGAFLSGGIDSSLIVALMQNVSSRPVRTFAIGFKDPKFDEAPYARAVAKHLGTDHQELYVDEAAMLAVVPKLGQLFSEPFADSSQIPTLLVSELARREVTVVLSGDGGDELFGGYSRYLWGERLWGSIARVPFGPRKIFGKVVGAVPGGVWEKLFDLLGPLLPNSSRLLHPGQKIKKAAALLAEVQGFEDLYRRLLTHWAHGELVVPGAVGDVTGKNPLLANSVDLRHWYMLGHDIGHYLPDDILTKVDRSAMAHSLESRVPFLNHRVVELALSFPMEFRIAAGKTKRIARDILGRYVPNELIDRPKRGFAVPLGAWLRGPLREWSEDLLSEQALQEHGLFLTPEIRKTWELHQANRVDAQYLLWDVLVFQAWWREWVR